MSQATVYIVDDDAEVRECVAALARAAGMETQEFESARAFLRAYEPGAPGCVVLDAWLNGSSGPDTLGELTSRRVGLPVIATTGRADIATAVRVVKAGAFDVLEKPLDGPRALETLRRAIHESQRTHEERAEQAEIRQRFAQLTRREREVAELVAQGMPSRTIAARLELGEKTVEVYRSRVKTKMQARNSADLARLVHCMSD